MSNAVHGKNAAVFINQFDVSNYLNQFNTTNTAPELNSTTFQDTAETFVPGFKSGSVGLEGFFSHDETNANTANDVFEAIYTASTNPVITIAPEGGSTFGKRALLQNAVETKHDVSGVINQLVMAKASARGEVNGGVLLAEKASRTATGSSTAVNNGAQTYHGAVGHLHVFSKSGTSPTLDVIIKHSLDDVTYVDLITFAQKTAVGSERVTTAGLSQSQVETATVGGAATASANVIVTVTGADITGSPVSFNVAVLNGDTAAQVAGKIRAATWPTAVTSLYTVGGSSTTVTLTRTVAAANDATLNIAIDGSTNSTGVPNAATSANTTAGIALGSIYQYVKETRTIGGSSTPTFGFAVAFARY